MLDLFGWLFPQRAQLCASCPASADALYVPHAPSSLMPASKSSASQLSPSCPPTAAELSHPAVPPSAATEEAATTSPILLEAPAITEAQVPATTTAPAPRLTVPVSATSSLMPLDIATRPAMPTGLGGMSSTTTSLAKSSPSPQPSPPSCYLATLPSLQLSPLQPSCLPGSQIPAVPRGFDHASPASSDAAAALVPASVVAPPLLDDLVTSLPVAAALAASVATPLP